MAFCDIIRAMKTKFAYIFPLITCLCAGAANANWQYDGEYTRDGWYRDDGGRFVLSVRGGASLGMANIKNNIGTLTGEYYVDPYSGVVVTAAYYDACVEYGGCGDYEYAGIGDLADLPAKENFSSVSFAAGASIGFTLPNRPQWRFELGWDHITEAEYNFSTLFEGDLTLAGGNVGDVAIHVESGSVQSKVSTDIISAMAFYDFYKGIAKPVNKFIPYIGLGVGYADTKTTLTLADLYGELSQSIDMHNFGDLDDFGVLNFYRSEINYSNIAGLIAAGVSYGLTERVFLDLSARVAYIPKIKWALRNADETRQRDWFSAENLIYANIMLGLRFEF